MAHSAEFAQQRNMAHIARAHEVTRLPNESTLLRESMPGNKEEVARLFKAEKSPYMFEVVGSVEDLNQDLSEQKDWMQSMKERSTVTFRTAVDAKTNKAAAWVRVDKGTKIGEEAKKIVPVEDWDLSEERARFKRLLGKKWKKTLTDRTPDPSEIAYAPVPGSEHLMASAIRNTCHLIEAQDKKDGLWSDTDKSLRRPVVVFEGDSEVGQFSRDALLAAGFELRSGEHLINYDKYQRKDTRMYVLNWDKFLQIKEGRKISQNHTPLDVDRVAQLGQIRSVISTLRDK